MGAQDILNEIVSLDETIMQLKAKFDTQPEEDKSKVLEAHFDTLLATDFDKDDVPLALARCLDMIGGLGDDNAVRILARGMRNDNPDIRHLAGEVLFMMAEDNVANVMPAVELALNEGGILAEELPFLIAEIDDPEAPRLVERFLTHDDPQVVVSAIEALVESGDENTLEALEPLKGDTRNVTLEEEGKPPTTSTVGAIVQDALELFSMEE